MDTRYYTIHFTEEQKAFIRDNLQYLVIDSNYYRFNAYDYICKNKLQCEYGVYLTTESRLKTFLISLPKNRHYWKIGEAGKTSWEELVNNFKEALESHGVTLEELQTLQRFSSLEYYSNVEKWEIKDRRKLVLNVDRSYANDIVIDFLLYLTDGKIREDLAQAQKLIDDNGTQYYKRVVFCVSETFTIGIYKIRCYQNGKVEISLNDKSSFSEGFIDRLERYIESSKKVHKNCEWYT